MLAFGLIGELIVLVRGVFLFCLEALCGRGERLNPSKDLATSSVMPMTLAQASMAG